jgi:hypothetical protein
MPIRPALICAAAALLASGCTAVTPRLDAQFGRTVEVLAAQQLIDPAAPQRSGASHLDGEAARETIQRYYKSYKAPAPPPGVFTINALGGG